MGEGKDSRGEGQGKGAKEDGEKEAWRTDILWRRTNVRQSRDGGKETEERRGVNIEKNNGDQERGAQRKAGEKKREPER